MNFSQKIICVMVSMSIFSIVSLSKSVDAIGYNFESKGSININEESDDLDISDVLTYDELVNELSKNEEITLEESKKFLGPEEFRNYDDVLKELMKQRNISIDDAKNMIKEDNIIYTKNGKQVRATYRTFTKSVEVKANVYKPKIQWYCETSEYGQYHGIVKIKRTSLDRSYNTLTKQFSGDLYSNLESADKIYYELNGDFYNYGTTTYSGGVEIGIGKYGTIKFSISNSSGHYAYCNSIGRFTWY